MKPILNNGSQDLEVNAIFIQPSSHCANNCKGCYVKARGPAQESNPFMNKFLKKCIFGEGITVNQITIAMNDLPFMLGDEVTPEASDLFNFWNLTLYFLLAKTEPEVHMTFNSLASLLEYQEYHHYMGIQERPITNLDMMSFSHIKKSDLEAIANYTKEVDINYNHLIPRNITSYNIDDYVAHIEEVGRVVNSIYLIIFKKPMDGLLSSSELEPASSRLAHSITVINTLRERLSKSVRSKIHVDGCLQDVRQSKRTGYGCSSNVSRFQVWPDGSVSGCPYAKRGFGEGKTRSVQDIMDNIREAKEHYEFRDRCNLTQVYDSICGLARSKRTKV